MMPGTDIIEITVTDANPKNAVRTVNTLAHVFTSFYQELSHQEGLDNLQFLETELGRAQAKLSEAEAKLMQFKRTNRISSSTDVTTNPSDEVKQAMTVRDSARAALAETQARLNRIESQLRTVGPSRTVVEGTSDTPVVRGLQDQLADLTRQLNDAKSKYQNTHPKVINLEDTISQVQAETS